MLTRRQLIGATLATAGLIGTPAILRAADEPVLAFPFTLGITAGDPADLTVDRPKRRICP